MELGTELAKRESTEVKTVELMEMTVDSVLQQAIKVQQVMRAVMKEGVHYGVIPGTDKPTLYKAGAEKLCFIFRLAPTYEIQRNDLPGGHREYTIICTLTHIPTGRVMAQGVGSCSTMEKKYRYRLGEAESTGQIVPKAYWDVRSKDPAKAQELIGGKGFVTKKIDNVWIICKKSEEHTENQDIADTYNTVLKIGKKRCFVDSTITATASSDCLTQDLEDMEEFASKMAPALEEKKDVAPATPPAATRAPTAAAPKPTPPGQQQQMGFSYKQSLWDSLKAYCNGDNKEAGGMCKELTGKAFYTSLTEGEAMAGLKKFQVSYMGVPEDEPGQHEDAQVVS